MNKIGILCASKLAIPTIGYLLQSGIAVEIILPDRTNEHQDELEYLLNSNGLYFQKWNKSQLNNELPLWAQNNQLNCIWVITFPFILSKRALNYLHVPIYNFHSAPLPEYRGAQPVFWLIKNQQKHGGITIHKLTEEIDAGPICHFEQYTLSEKETFGSYMNKMAQLNVQASHHFIQKCLQGDIKKSAPQNAVNAQYYKKPSLEDVMINWDKMKANEIEAMCRACNPWNKGAVTNLNGRMIKLIEVEIVKRNYQNEGAGQIVMENSSNHILVCTSDQKFLRINILASEEGIFSYKTLDALDFRSGMRFS